MVFTDFCAPSCCSRQSGESFGDWVFWDTWVDYRIMEQHINLAEFWRSRDRRSPRLYMSRSHKLYWSCSKQFRPGSYDMKLTLGYFHNFILNGRKSLKLSKHSLAGGESLAWRPVPIPLTPVAGSIWTPSSFQLDTLPWPPSVWVHSSHFHA